MTWTAGDRVQVFNPHALAVGTVVEDAPDDAARVRVEWPHGDRTWSQARLLRVLETAEQRGLT